MESRLEESVFDDKTNLAGKQKKKIAEDALTLVGHEESVFLDGGSTTLFACEASEATDGHNRGHQFRTGDGGIG